MTAATVPLDRDYAAEMRAVLDQEIARSNGDAAPVVAARVATRLRATDADLLAGWLDFQAVTMLTDAVGRIDCAARSHARSTARRAAFERAAATGDVARLQPFLDSRWTADEQHHRLPLRDLTREHLLFVARGYEQTARTARMEAAFFRVLSKKVGSGTVGDHFTEDAIADLHRSITKSHQDG